MIENIHSFIELKKPKIRKVDDERTKSKIPHPNVHVEKGVLKEIEGDIIKINKIHVSKSKNIHCWTSQTNVFPTIKFLSIVLHLIAPIV